MERKELWADSLRSWSMVVLTMVFVALYALVLFGWLRPFADITVITRIEPVIFVIIGFFFGKLPLQQTERILRDELIRQKVKADTALQVKESVEIEKEVMVEKIRNARAALLPVDKDSIYFSCTVPSHDGSTSELNGGVYNSIKTAVKILGI